MRYNPSIYLDNMNTGGRTNMKTHMHTSVPLLLCSCNLMQGQMLQPAQQVFTHQVFFCRGHLRLKQLLVNIQQRDLKVILM